MEAKDPLYKPALIDEKNILHWEILLTPVIFYVYCFNSLCHTLSIASTYNRLFCKCWVLQNKEPYHKGGFKISIDFPADYPFRPPALTFLTKIYHPNVDEKGKICLGIIAPHHWKPATKVEQSAFESLKNK